MDYLSWLATNSLALVNRITRMSPNEKTKLNITKSDGRRSLCYVATSEMSEFDQEGSPLPFHYPGWLSPKDRKLLLQSSTRSAVITQPLRFSPSGTFPPECIRPKPALCS
ncbi:hypothetical protein NE237_012508 [Protea cynaroides]|uniref:Uncharacterized protein n=1 Tax=Protea cynaroides TaxID=273540 RepID=A0A9Q0GY70_9MAGN|nr:hypothetical protein NE237_012508 [Protea cynaroides]